MHASRINPSGRKINSVFCAKYDIFRSKFAETFGDKIRASVLPRAQIVGCNLWNTREWSSITRKSRPARKLKGLLVHWSRNRQIEC